MTTWGQFHEESPALADAIAVRLRAAKHHVLATVRRDGSPRVSGSEVSWRGPELTIGSMPGARKARDLQRDARFALHANPGDESMSGGDAKLSGRAVEIVDVAELRSLTGTAEVSEDSHFFRLDLAEAVLTRVSDDETHLVISRWRPGSGVTVFTRA
ncbi:pyridoxamine 5'-phosphate oxidase family protein [Allosaccharopolyspora coralli]|uniref:Pyridoxamine 5'-phosphate oxidase family protein n=1 Tax=Allosaccharopolyspora coralli TaxID=2665642 RepID=A0A5Q3QB14_9PSEU|nr:pyridoxamine 5'-phosphate oxidase family protein [Allosaccharopolyspora coralli]QGK71851.1 pyridoxamine 5'-phosphate oxidase family protein [Allosaccharopolyspora coralli]